MVHWSSVELVTCEEAEGIVYLSEVPEVAALWHPTKNNGVTPGDVTVGMNRHYWWVCPETGEPYQAPVDSQVTAGASSPFMAGRRVLVGYNDLASQFPDIAALWHPTRNGEVTPETVVYGSGFTAWWVCPVSGGEFPRRVVEYTRNNRPSPFVTGKKVWPGYNDLASQYPGLVPLWHPTMNGKLTPESVMPGSGKIVWWVCPVSGGEYPRAVREQVKRGGVSPFMVNQSVHAGFNDLATTHPDIAALWHPTRNGLLAPSMIPSGSEKTVWWVCPDSGVEYDRMVCKQVESGPRSPYMTGARVLPGYNDLASQETDIAALWHPTKNGALTPTDVTTGSTEKVWWVCPETGRDYHRTVNNTVHRSHTYPTVSGGEQEVADFVESIVPEGTRVLRRDRFIIAPKELDIVVPDRMIAVEFNGLYWHSEAQGKGRWYHREKCDAARAAGYQLITIWEDEWRDRRDVVEAMLRHKLGVDNSRTVGARKCRVVTLDHHTAARFLDRHHIQGSATGSVYLGLQDHDGALVAVSVWRKLKSELFLDRYATSCTVPGGMGKLLKAGCDWGRDHDCDVVVTFSDHEVSDGGLYDRLGFTRDRELKPDYRYVYGGVRCHKFGFRLKRFRNDPDLLWQEGLSERELAELNSIPRVWDAGKTRHVMEIPAGERTVAGLF